MAPLSTPTLGRIKGSNEEKTQEKQQMTTRLSRKESTLMENTQGRNILLVPLNEEDLLVDNDEAAVG